MDARQEVIDRVMKSVNALRRDLEAAGVEVDVSVKAVITLKTGAAASVDALPDESHPVIEAPVNPRKNDKSPRR